MTINPPKAPRHVKLATLALTLFITAPGMNAHAREGDKAPPETANGQIMMIMDGSGSMWGQLRNRNKIYLARDAIKRVLPQFHNRLTMGLIAFGQHSKRSCKDVSQIAPLKRLNAAQFIKAFETVNPLGRTPLTLALKKAADALDYTRKKSTIIMLIDGFENCRGNPCKLARQLKRDGKDLTIHVIGLGMKPGDRRKISCVTNTNKGELITATSGDSLERAFSNLLARTATTPREIELAAPAKRPVISRPKGPPELLLTAMMAAKGPQLAAGLEWRVRPKGSGGRELKDLYLGEAPQPRIKLPAGDYIVEARLDGIKITEDVTVARFGLTRATLNFDAGRVKIRAYADRGSKPLSNVFYTIYKQSKKSGLKDKVVAITSKPDPEYTLPAGSYNILVQHGGTRSERVINVISGKTGNIDIVMYSGELVLRAIDPQDGTAIEGAFYFIFEDDPLAPGGRREVARSAARTPDFRLPAGTYHIRVKWGQSVKEMRVTVRAGKRKTLTIPMQSGTVILNARITVARNLTQDGDDKYPITYSILRLPPAGGVPRLIIKTSRPKPKFNLDAGKYLIIANYGAVNARARSEVQIGSGQTKTVNLDIPAALMALKFKLADGKHFSRDVFWTITTPDGQPIWTTGKPAPRTPISPGTYMVIAEYRGKLYRQPLKLKAGELKDVTITTN